MIHIIEEGQTDYWPDNKPHAAECDECHCRFTHTREDCWWSSPLLTYIVKCPYCGNDVWVGDIYK